MDRSLLPKRNKLNINHKAFIFEGFFVYEGEFLVRLNYTPIQPRLSSMPNRESTDEMTAREMHRSIQTMAESITQLSNNVSTLVESDIRRQERETRQQDFNNHARGRLESLEEWKQDLEIKRASESQGREILNRYWWVLMLIGGYAVYKLTKNGLITQLLS